MINGNDRQNFNESYKWTLKQSKRERKMMSLSGVLMLSRKLGAALTLDTEMVTRPRSSIEPVENLFQMVKGQRLMAEMC